MIRYSLLVLFAGIGFIFSYNAIVEPFRSQDNELYALTGTNTPGIYQVAPSEAVR